MSDDALTLVVALGIAAVIAEVVWIVVGSHWRKR